MSDTDNLLRWLLKNIKAMANVKRYADEFLEPRRRKTAETELKKGRFSDVERN